MDDIILEVKKKKKKCRTNGQVGRMRRNADARQKAVVDYSKNKVDVNGTSPVITTIKNCMVD